MLNERLLTIEWQQRTLPDVDHVAPGTWLLISTSTTADVMATRLTDALKAEGARCATMTWPQHSDHQANAELLGSHLGADEVSGVVILTGPKNGNPDEECALRGGDYVRHLVRIAREITEIPARTTAPIRRDAERPDRVAGRRDEPGAGRAPWPGASDQH